MQSDRFSSPSRDESADPSLNFQEILATLQRGKWIILATCLLVTAIVGTYTYMRTPIFRARSIISVDADDSYAPAEIAGTQINASSSLQEKIGVLRNSAELPRRVADTLLARVDDPNKSSFPILHDSETGQTLPVRGVASRISDRIEFSMLQSEGMIAIAMESQAPREASVIANLYAHEYKEFSREKARSSITAKRQFLEAEAKKRRREISRLEEKWEAFAKEHEVVVQGSEGQNLASQYTQLRSRRSDLAVDLETERAQLERLRQKLSELEENLQTNFQEEQRASGLQTQIRALETKIAEMQVQAANYYAANPELEGDTARIQSEYPKLASLVEQIEAFERRKQKLTRQLINLASGSEGSGAASGSAIERVSQLRQQVQEKELVVSQLQSQINALDSKLQGHRAQLDNIPEQQTRGEALQRKLSRAESFYESIMSELQKTTVAEESELGYVEVVRPASIPTVPARPNVARNLIMGILLGFGFGIGMAFFREATNTLYRTPEEIEEQGYTLIGVVPHMDGEIQELFDGADFVKMNGSHKVNTRLFPLLKPFSPMSEHYRHIQTNLKHSGEKEPETILVTSPEPEDGKTTTAVNLAITAAQGGNQVLLIDADMRGASAHSFLDLPRSPGLSNILRDEQPFTNGERGSSGPMQETFIDRLHFLPAGNGSPLPVQELDSHRMRTLLQHCQEYCDTVILDSPPILAATDATMIAPQVDATLLVVSANTDQEALELSMKSLHSVGASLKGIVFNQFNQGQLRGYYSSYSNYQYELPSGEREEHVEPA